MERWCTFLVWPGPALAVCGISCESVVLGKEEKEMLNMSQAQHNSHHPYSQASNPKDVQRRDERPRSQRTRLCVNNLRLPAQVHRMPTIQMLMSTCLMPTLVSI